jgi:hypothetical protein
MDQRTTITLPSGVRRITDPAAYVAALEAREKIIQKKANRVHGKTGVDGIFKVDKVSAVYQKPRQTHRPSNHLSAPIPGAPTPSHLTRYRIRTGWVLTLQEQQILLMWAKADDRRKDRPALAEHDKSPLSPLPSLISNPPMVIYPRWWWRRKRWHFERSRGIWPDPRHCTGYRWSKIALALHFHKLVLKLSSKRQWRHLPVDDRIAAALLGFSEAIHRFDQATHTNGLTAYAIWWIRKELQRLAHNERRQPRGDHTPYGFGEAEFGPGIPMSFRPRAYPLIRYDENSYRRRPQYVNIGDDCVVENIKLGAPADDNDDVEHAGPSFANWSPINPETALLFKESAWEKYKYRSAAEIAQMCDDQIDAATVRAMRDDWRERQKRNRVVTPAQPIKASAAFDMVALPASVFAAV